MQRHARVALAFLSAVILCAPAAQADDPPPAAAPPPGYGPPPGYPPPGYPPPGYPPGYPPPGYPPGYPPPGYPPPGYPPGYAPPQYYAPVDNRPMYLEYDEGQPIPEGYHLQSRVRKGLIGAGAGVFGGLWFASVVVGATGSSASYNEDAWVPLFIPLVGPFVAIDTLQSDTLGTFALVVDGLGQVGGLTMLILGAVLPQKQLVRNLSLSPSVTVAPVFTGNGVGVTGTF